MKPVLLLLHGALGGADQFAALVPRLAPAWDTHVLELPGHGEQPLGDCPFELEAFGAWVGRYIETRGLVRPTLFGHSMGGLVGLMLARARPELLSAVITLGTRVYWPEALAHRAVARMDPAHMEAANPALAAALAVRHRALGWQRLLAHTQALTAALATRPPLTPARLGELAVPVRFGVADDDHLVPRDEAGRVAAQIPGGVVWTLAGAHGLESLDLDLLAGRLRGFAG